jgi:uncharacterized membrane protein
MLEFLPPLNDHNLPYPDTIHPIVVHFVIAMVLFAVLCDFIGYFTRNPNPKPILILILIRTLTVSHPTTLTPTSLDSYQDNSNCLPVVVGLGVVG